MFKKQSLEREVSCAPGHSDAAQGTWLAAAWVSSGHLLCPFCFCFAFLVLFCLFETGILCVISLVILELSL